MHRAIINLEIWFHQGICSKARKAQNGPTFSQTVVLSILNTSYVGQTNTVFVYICKSKTKLGRKFNSIIRLMTLKVFLATKVKITFLCNQELFVLLALLFFKVNFYIFSVRERELVINVANKWFMNVENTAVYLLKCIKSVR